MFDRSTTLAWLSLTVAADRSEDPTADPLQVLGSCPLPLAVIDLEARELRGVSPRFVEFVGLDAVPPANARIAALVPPADRVDLLCELLLDGTIDSFEGQRTMQVADRARPVTSWVSVIDRADRRRALWVLAPHGAEEFRAAPVTPPIQWPRTIEGAVVGRLDASLAVVEISRGVERALGYRREDLLGRPAVEFVHPDEVHVLLTAIARALADRTPVGTELRIRHDEDGWRRMHTMIVPLDSDELRIGYSLVPIGEDAPEAAAPMGRLHDLEQRLRRIAGEVEAAGMAMGAVDTRARDLPELVDLPPRQWEVLARLTRGERVPAIARELFLSQSTVRNHLTSIYRRLGVNSQQELLDLLRTATPRAS